MTSSREAFLHAGRLSAASIESALERVRPGAPAGGLCWLDHGCGSGRVLRHLVRTDRRLWGVDVDAAAVGWARGHLRDCQFADLAPGGPLPFASSFFDVVVSVSVFTHLDESNQGLWLAEIRRILKPGGLFLASTHSAALTFTRPDLTADQLAALSAAGFLFAPGGGPFSEDSAFHGRVYLERTWGKSFVLREFTEFGLAGYQDLSVWEKPPDPPALSEPRGSRPPR